MKSEMGNAFADVLFWPFVASGGVLGWYLIFGDVIKASTFWTW